jgi:peroxiredoxin
MRILIILFFFILGFNYIGSAQIPDKAEDISPLLISEKIPDSKLIDALGNEFSLANLVSEKNTVLLFYRGGWCPYCTAHLAAVGEIENEIDVLGYQIIAISPDAPATIEDTGEKIKTKYLLLSDPGGELMKKMGIAFQAPTRYKDMLMSYSDDLNDGFLPVPSIFVVSKEGTIVFEYISPDYKQRIEGSLLLSILKNLTL